MTPDTAATGATPSQAYQLGHQVGEQMAQQRAAGDYSYDCRWDLADAAKEGKKFFEDFKRGLDEGLNK